MFIKLLCSFMKKKTDSVFPAFCHATFHHDLIKCCNDPKRGTVAQIYHDQESRPCDQE